VWLFLDCGCGRRVVVVVLSKFVEPGVNLQATEPSQRFLTIVETLFKLKTLQS